MRRVEINHRLTSIRNCAIPRTGQFLSSEQPWPVGSLLPCLSYSCRRKLTSSLIREQQVSICISELPAKFSSGETHVQWQQYGARSRYGMCEHTEWQIVATEYGNRRGRFRGKFCLDFNERASCRRNS